MDARQYDPEMYTEAFWKRRLTWREGQLTRLVNVGAPAVVLTRQHQLIHEALTVLELFRQVKNTEQLKDEIDRVLSIPTEEFLSD